MGGRDRLVIWLHGLGADGGDLMPIAELLALPDELGVRHLFPDAPMRPVTINGGYVMRAWYDIWGIDLQAGVDEQGIADSVRLLRELIEREQPQQLVLVGFSQGGVIALGTALALASPPQGVAMLSSYAPFADLSPCRGLPVFIGHGSQDTVVPAAAAADAEARLQAAGAGVEYRRYPMAHSICEAEIQHLRSWLLRTLA